MDGLQVNQKTRNSWGEVPLAEREPEGGASPPRTGHRGPFGRGPTGEACVTQSVEIR